MHAVDHSNTNDMTQAARNATQRNPLLHWLVRQYSWNFSYTSVGRPCFRQSINQSATSNGIAERYDTLYAVAGATHSTLLNRLLTFQSAALPPYPPANQPSYVFISIGMRA